MRKGFTFAQMATLILVIMGLTVAVVLAATQLSRSGSQFSQLGAQSGAGVEDAGEAAASLGTACIAEQGFCTATACATDAGDGNEDCPTLTPYCCSEI